MVRPGTVYAGASGLDSRTDRQFRYEAHTDEHRADDSAVVGANPTATTKTRAPSDDVPTLGRGRGNKKSHRINSRDKLR